MSLQLPRLVFDLPVPGWEDIAIGEIDKFLTEGMDNSGAVQVAVFARDLIARFREQQEELAELRHLEVVRAFAGQEPEGLKSHRTTVEVIDSCRYAYLPSDWAVGSEVIVVEASS